MRLVPISKPKSRDGRSSTQSAEFRLAASQQREDLYAITLKVLGGTLHSVVHLKKSDEGLE